MSDNTQTASSLNKFRFIDILVLVVFISTAFLGLYLFRKDLMRTIDTRDMEPAGIITIKNNIVQRRHEERVLWDRIYVDSLVYPGDLIRVAEMSSTAIDIEKNELFLNENTLIRIQRSMSDNNSFHIELHGGEISVTSSTESLGIMLDVMGKQVQAMSGSVLNASAGEDGVSVQVSEGKAEFVQKGKSREITEGAMIAFDSKGEEKIIPSAVVTSPKPNARYLKSGNERLVVDFLWNRVNFKEDGNLSLEIAGDSVFSRNVSVLKNLNDSAQAAFDNGLWYWRLLYDGKVLKSGHLTVVNSSGPVLVSPVNGSIFRYQDSAPQVRFQWEERQNAIGYIIEISDTGDFSNLRISTRTNAASFVSSKLAEGTFYWRVKPVFFSTYKGEAAYSSIGSFQIIKTSEKTAAAVEIEIPVIPPERITSASSSPPLRISSEPVIVRSAPKPVPDSEPKNSAKQEIKPTPKPEPKSEPKLAVKPDPKPEPKPELKSAVRQPSAPVVNSSSAYTNRAVRNYTIQPGDTLGKIARQYYGDPMQWMRITEANNIKNPDLIYPGQVFIIP